MRDTFCARCGRYLPEGSMRYIVHIQIAPDVDEFLSYLEKNPSEEVEELLKKLESAEVEELEDGVYQGFSVYLCEQCKEKFAYDPFNSQEALSSRKDVGNVFH